MLEANQSYLISTSDNWNGTINPVEGEKEADDGYISYADRPETFIVPVLFGVIFLVGVLGNASLIWILLRHKAMRSVPNTFIFNLALGDLLVLLCSVPFTSTVFTLDSWPYGLFVCKASEFAKVLDNESHFQTYLNNSTKSCANLSSFLLLAGSLFVCYDELDGS